MTNAIAQLCCLAGFACIALAMDRPQHELLRRALSRSVVRSLQATGAVALLAALVVLRFNMSLGLALVNFSAHTSVAAGIIYLALVWHHLNGS